MATFLWTNNASSTLAAPISSVATSVNVATGTGAEFPNPGAGQQFTFTMNDAATGLLTEIMYCTARSTDTLTVTRGQEGTVAQNWNAGDLCANLITAGALAAFFQSGTFQGQQSTCYLEYVSATEISLLPKGGDTIIINGSLYSLPSGGLNSSPTGVSVNGVGGQNLAASTVYDLFVEIVLGALTFDFWSTSGHITDTSAGNIGVEVRNNSGTPDSSRSYVGKIATNAASHFQAQGIGVLSWFNRKQIGLSGAGVTISGITSGTPVELSSTGRVSFLAFADNAISATINGFMGNTTTGDPVQATILLDGLTWTGSSYSQLSASSGERSNLAVSNTANVLEGQHYVTPAGYVPAGGSGTFTVDAQAQVWG